MERVHGVAASILLLGGCAAGPYHAEYRFEPHPAQVEMVMPGDDGSARVLASVIGLRRGGDGAPPSIEIRWRLDNRTPAAVEVDAAALELVAGDLAPFGEPATDPPGAFTLAPGQSVTVQARFPLPRSTAAPDLSGLGLSWTVRARGGAMRGSQTFSRVRPPPPAWSHWHRHGHLHIGGGYWCD
jgi:hypothetical protein